MMHYEVLFIQQHLEDTNLSVQSCLDKQSL